MAQAWFIRAGRDDEFDELVFTQGVVVIGWRRVGDLSRCTDKSMIASLVAAAYPGTSHPTQNSYTIQLHVFRHLMEIDDIVVLLRSKTPDIGLGRVTGEYHYLSDGAAVHCRTVEWVNRELRRSEVPELVEPPALSAIYRVNAGMARLQELLGRAGTPVVEPPRPETGETSALATSAAYDNLSRNLNYARNLAAAGSHLEQLKVNLFEVTDVYRAAWVQAVAAIDHWVRQEIYDRMIRLSENPKAARPGGYAKFQLPMSMVEEIHSGRITLSNALRELISASISHETYQNPRKIKEGLSLVADVNDLWQRVANVLKEQEKPSKPLSGKDVEARLVKIVFRRNKIAHEYDEDPENRPNKRSIDVETTMDTINWLDGLALSLLVVLDQE